MMSLSAAQSTQNIDAAASQEGGTGFAQMLDIETQLRLPGNDNKIVATAASGAQLAAELPSQEENGETMALLLLAQGGEATSTDEAAIPADAQTEPQDLEAAPAETAETETAPSKDRPPAFLIAAEDMEAANDAAEPEAAGIEAAAIPTETETADTTDADKTNKNDKQDGAKAEAETGNNPSASKAASADASAIAPALAGNPSPAGRIDGKDVDGEADGGELSARDAIANKASAQTADPAVKDGAAKTADRGQGDTFDAALKTQAGRTASASDGGAQNTAQAAPAQSVTASAAASQPAAIAALAQPVAAATQTAAASAPAVAAKFTVSDRNESDETVSSLDRLGLTIAAKSSQGARQFDIRLDPPELGKIEARLSFDDSGKAQLVLAADKPQTLNLLQRDAGSLMRTMQEAGIDLSGGALNFSLRGGQNNNGQTGGGRSGSRIQSLAAVATVDADAAADTGLRLHADGVRLDIKI